MNETAVNDQTRGLPVRAMERQGRGEVSRENDDARSRWRYTSDVDAARSVIAVPRPARDGSSRL